MELPQQCLGRRGRRGSPLWTTGDYGPRLPKPCAPATKPSTPLTSPCQAVLTPSGNRVLWLRLKLGPSGTQMPPFICGKVGPGEGSDPVTQQVNVSGSLHSRFLTTGWCLFSYYSTCHLPNQSPLQTPVSPSVLYQQGHKSRCSPLVTLPGSCPVLLPFNPHKSAGGRYCRPHFMGEATTRKSQSHTASE